MVNIGQSLRARLWRLARLPYLPRYKREIAQIVQNHSPETPIVIFLPGLDWRGPLIQRPQHLARALARKGLLVFYIQPEHTALPAGVSVVENNLFQCQIPLEAFRGIDKAWVHAFTWNGKYAARLDQPRLIYDWVDDLSAFEGSFPKLEQQHQKLLTSAEVVLVTARGLYEQALAKRSDALLCPNGVDYEHFAAARRRSSPYPADLATVLERGCPVIGYHGVLARWFDYDLLREVAGLRTDLSFVLIGSDYDGSLGGSGLQQQSNIFYLGVRPYAILPAYLSWFDAGIIPFQLNEITHATSPLKLFEFMAAGKAVVITPMQESMRTEGVLVSEGVEEFSCRLDEALAQSQEPAYLSLSERVARENTWEKRAGLLLHALDCSGKGNTG